jgi:CRISPR-associated protein Cmr2
MQHASGGITTPDPISQTVPDFSNLLSSNCLAIQVDFELLTPWYSKDDRVFHVMDNPVRKDRVFGVPFMAASSWKGMLRWACRMRDGLHDHLEKHNGKIDGWRDPDWILHLFGNEKGEEDHEKLHQGALVFYPTWFDRIGFEVINPHSRERRAGTQPIYYEVVPPGAKGTLSLLYAPWPGMKFNADPQKVLPELLEAVEVLLTTYGISAKRTVGWGTAEIKEWRAYRKGLAEPKKATKQEYEQWSNDGTRNGKRFCKFFWEEKVKPLLIATGGAP